MKKTTRITMGLITSTVIVLSGATAAMAGTDNEPYNTTVGKFNGSGYTGYQVKDIYGATGRLESATVGGDYLVDARMQSSNGATGSWARNVSDGTNHDLVNGIANGQYVRVQFSNDAFTPVDVQVTGDWRSN
ncbi:hypothetical protein [Cryobacterium sp. Y50]|uniref:hypothetical protein n=1 Tax=Cryobacterium sp. Y50 TaxID=2048286 RepID=UPI000CE3A46B|nr:hypothetical protein [Cryobacterium sp. Y50]